MKSDHDWLSSIRDVLLSKSGNLIDLAKEAKLNPKTMYIGTRLDGADLKDQDLRGIIFTHLDSKKIQKNENTFWDENPLGTKLTHTCADTPISPENENYSIYTTSYDEIAKAETLVRELDANKNSKPGIYLELLSETFLLPDILDHGYSKSLKKYADSIAITLLIDNSGSMRGKPIQITAHCALTLSQFLDKNGINSEVLGFTTRSWKGGRSREKWRDEWSRNKKDRTKPGRINELRHIVYKDYDSSFAKSKDNFKLMLRDGFLKENIDGEDLIWAANRILTQKKKHRFIIILSDGAPVDDATLSANSPKFLDDHLRWSINEIETKSNINLIAIGIGHEVSRYYNTSIEINDAEQLDTAIMQTLDKISDIAAQSPSAATQTPIQSTP